MEKQVVKYDVVVIGGGISGVTAAYYHQKKGLNVAIVEATDRLGGVIQSRKTEFGILELGPNSMAMNDKLRSIVVELKLDSELLSADDQAKKRYIYLDGSPKLVYPKTILFSNKILSFKARRKMLSERFRKANIQKDETLASAIERRLGAEVLQRMINPVVSGIFAGDTNRLEYKSSLKKLYAFEDEYGSFTKGFFKTRKKGVKREVVSSSNGLGGLIQKIGNELNTVLFNSLVTDVQYKNEKHLVELSNEIFECDKLIFATPAYVTSKWIEDQKLSARLNEIRYPKLNSFQFVFKKEDVKSPLHSFGVLFPKEEGKSSLGIINYSSIFPSNTDEQHLMFTVFSNKNTVTQEELKEQVLAELKELYEIKESPVFDHIKVWDKAIPQFEVGYAQLMVELDEYCDARPGLEIIGNWRTGVSVGDCIY